MDEDFPNAARRHWRDGETLLEQERLENADQHYGFAAECALKSALVSLGSFREGVHHRHINELWNKIQRTSFYRSYPGLVQLLTGSNPFADWEVRQRYFADGYVSEETLQRHKDRARRLLRAANLYRG
jgi:hypothetical protein